MKNDVKGTLIINVEPRSTGYVNEKSELNSAWDKFKCWMEITMFPTEHCLIQYVNVNHTG